MNAHIKIFVGAIIIVTIASIAWAFVLVYQDNVDWEKFRRQNGCVQTRYERGYSATVFRGGVPRVTRVPSRTTWNCNGVEYVR